MSRRWAAAVDANQSEIVDALRKSGATVEPLHSVGAGCPDLLVGYRGKNWLMEVKDVNKPPSKKKLNERQVEWHRDWRGQVATVETSGAALAVIGAIGMHLAGSINGNERKA